MCLISLNPSRKADDGAVSIDWWASPGCICSVGGTMAELFLGVEGCFCGVASLADVWGLLLVVEGCSVSRLSLTDGREGVVASGLFSYKQVSMHVFLVFLWPRGYETMVRKHEHASSMEQKTWDSMFVTFAAAPANRADRRRGGNMMGSISRFVVSSTSRVGVLPEDNEEQFAIALFFRDRTVMGSLGGGLSRSEWVCMMSKGIGVLERKHGMFDGLVSDPEKIK